MFGHLGVAGTTLATLLWGGTPWQDALSSPPLTFRMEGTVAFRPEDTPKDQFVVFGAGHEIQDTLDIPQPPPGGRLLLVLDAIPVLGDDGLPVDNWTRPARVVAGPKNHKLVLWSVFGSECHGAFHAVRWGCTARSVLPRRSGPEQRGERGSGNAQMADHQHAPPPDRRCAMAATAS